MDKDNQNLNPPQLPKNEDAREEAVAKAASLPPEQIFSDELNLEEVLEEDAPDARQ